MINGYFDTELYLLRENKELQKNVNVYLENALFLDPNLKGFNYLSDIITLSLTKKRYSRATITELLPFIAWKNGIKEYSVQRQLRYVCTIRGAKKLKVDRVIEQTWNYFRTNKN